MADTNNNKIIALVTGANKGLGYQICMQLAERGASVIIGARDPQRGEEAAARLRSGGADAHHVALDVTDQATIAAAAGWVEARHGRLDVLVNNAGISVEGGQTPTETTAEQMTATYATNVFGPVAVTHAMLPLLRRSPAARVVMLSSTVGSLTVWSDPASPLRQFAPAAALAYNSSKTALNAVVVAYAIALADDGIKVNAADPGYVATDLNAHRGDRSVEQGARIAVRLATLPDDGPTGAFVSDEGSVPW